MEQIGRKAEVTIRLSEFEMPPMQDILLVGRHAAIGPEAARRMAEAIAPDLYEVIPLDSGPVEAAVVRRRLLELVPRERLLPIVLEEVQRLSPENLVIRGQISLDIVVRRQVDL